MNTLCRERLCRLCAVLDRQGGRESVRELARRFSIWGWEVEEAERLGWLKIVTHKPRVGRPSRIAVKLSETEAAELPPWRRFLGRRISVRHSMFAMRCCFQAVKHGLCFMGHAMSPWTEAYMQSFPDARSRAGAQASMSRLLKHPHVRAAMAWYYACGDGVVPKGELIPWTVREIRNRLVELGSWRARTVPQVVARW